MGATFWNYIHDKAGVPKIHQIARKHGFLTLGEYLQTMLLARSEISVQMSIGFECVPIEGWAIVFYNLMTTSSTLRDEQAELQHK